MDCAPGTSEIGYRRAWRAAAKGRGDLLNTLCGGAPLIAFHGYHFRDGTNTGHHASNATAARGNQTTDKVHRGDLTVVVPPDAEFGMAVGCVKTQ